MVKLKGHLNVFTATKNTPETSSSKVVQQFKEHLGAHLANKLKLQFERFQLFRKVFTSVLYERIDEFAATKKQLESEVAQDSINIVENEVDHDNSREFETSQYHQQVVLDTSDELLLHERDQEIDKVVNDVNYIHEVMNQIQVLTVEQGSLLDRIDVNLDSARTNLHKTIGKLEKTAERFSLHQKRLIIFCLTLMIFAASLAIFFKK